MSDLYELATMAFPLLSTPQVAEAVRDWVSAPAAEGHSLGSWRTEIGPLGRLLVLRRFDDDAALTRERRRALFSTRPFNAGSYITTLEMDTYSSFPFLPPMQFEVGILLVCVQVQLLAGLVIQRRQRETQFGAVFGRGHGQRATTAITKGFHRLGLGLYITREIVAAHGGTIKVTSSVMEGTTFTARFPRSQPNPAREDAERHA